MDAIVQSLDSYRVSVLRLSLRLKFLRALYSQAHTRLGFGFLVTSLFYFPLAVLRPEILLSFGPMIFGYPHLVASYRFTPAFKRYGLILVMTAVAMALHVFKVGAPLPFGVWQMVVATATMLIVRSPKFMDACIAMAVCGGFMKLAWMEPLIFVGGMLILHNWVAFFYWIKVSKNAARRRVAVASTFLFLVVHVLVLGGVVDSMIPTVNGNIVFAGNSQNTAWMLASWSADQFVWYRLMILYAFGLSVHYFVWLRAIPESQKMSEHPSSFRMIAENLKMGMGMRALILTLCVSVGGVILWMFSRPLGAQVYFEIAILHGAIEMMFLLPESLSVRRAT